MAAALVALRDQGVHPEAGDLLGVTARRDGRHRDDAPLGQLADQPLVGRLGEARHLDPLAHEEVDDPVDVGVVGAEVDPERAVGAFFDLADRRA